MISGMSWLAMCIRYLLLLILLILSGCVSVHWQNSSGAISHVGSIWYDQYESADAKTIEINSIGLDLRFQEEDSGFSIGYRKVISGCPGDSQASAEYTNGWLSKEEMISNRGYFHFTKNVGLDISTNTQRQFFVLGFQRSTIIGLDDVNQSSIRTIDFYEDSPHNNRVLELTGGSQQ